MALREALSGDIESNLQWLLLSIVASFISLVSGVNDSANWQGSA